MDYLMYMMMQKEEEKKNAKDKISPVDQSTLKPNALKDHKEGKITSKPSSNAAAWDVLLSDSACGGMTRC